MLYEYLPHGGVATDNTVPRLRKSVGNRLRRNTVLEFLYRKFDNASAGNRVPKFVDFITRFHVFKIRVLVRPICLSLSRTKLSMASAKLGDSLHYG